MTSPTRVAVTGAAGQISYSLLFRIAAGEMLGPDRPVQLQLLEIPPAMKALEGVVMELEDCAFPLVQGIEIADDPRRAFAGAQAAMLVGARPRGPGMERSDLLEANANIFTAQGAALNEVADRDVKVVVVGNPANTNAWIAMKSAPDLAPRNFTGMTRLDHNRAIAQLAAKTGKAVSEISRMTIWGNHSTTQFPDIAHAEVAGEPAAPLVDRSWYENDYIPRVAKRGAEIIDARGASSAASAANAALEHIRDWFAGTPANDWTSMAVLSDGSYGIEPGLVYSFPVTCADGQWSIVEALEIDEFARSKMDATAAELMDERDAVAGLVGG